MDGADPTVVEVPAPDWPRQHQLRKIRGAPPLPDDTSLARPVAPAGVPALGR